MCDSVVLRIAYVLVINPFLVDPPTEPLNVYSVGQHIFFCFMKQFESEKCVHNLGFFSVFFSRIVGYLFDLLDGFALIRLHPQRIPVFMPKCVVMIPEHISYAKLLIAFLSY